MTSRLKWDGDEDIVGFGSGRGGGVDIVERVPPHHDIELVARRVARGAQPVVDAGAVPLAQLPANIQAQAGATAACREERLEQVTLDIRRDGGPVARDR